jgi:hypothetical protein
MRRHHSPYGQSLPAAVKVWTESRCPLPRSPDSSRLALTCLMPQKLDRNDVSVLHLNFSTMADQ